MGSIRADRAIDFGRSWVRTRSIAKLLELLRDLRPTPPCSAISGIKVQLLLVLGLNWLRAARIVAPATFLWGWQSALAVAVAFHRPAQAVEARDCLADTSLQTNKQTKFNLNVRLEILFLIGLY